MTTWWWVRHGPTHRKDMIGWTDAPADLSDQAQLARLRDYLPTNAPVVSSDLIRAIETADALQGTRQRHAHTPHLRELHFGNWEARHFDEIDQSDGALIRKFWEEPGDIAAPGGESWNDLSTRVSSFVDQTGAHPHVIAVAHMGTILTQVQRAMGLTAYDTLSHKIDNLSVTVIRRSGGDWTLETINHLP